MVQAAQGYSYETLLASARSKTTDQMTEEEQRVLPPGEYLAKWRAEGKDPNFKPPKVATATALEPNAVVTHFDKVVAHLARFEREFADAVQNPHAPAELLGALLQAIHLLRTEVAFLHPKS